LQTDWHGRFHNASATADEVAGLRAGTTLALRARTGILLGSLELEDIYRYDRSLEAESVYLTSDDAHPGVRALNSQGEFLLGGRITLIEHSRRTEFAPYRFSPADARAEFVERDWKRVVAFQTRNPVHRAHEYIQKCALETVDGLFLHPIVGDTKADDIPAQVRVRAYEVILDKYYPSERTLLEYFRGDAVRGPREAIFHAIIRKNYDVHISLSAAITQVLQLLRYI
jgi:sulfate adenylyltransferase